MDAGVSADGWRQRTVVLAVLVGAATALALRGQRRRVAAG